MEGGDVPAFPVEETTDEAGNTVTLVRPSLTELSQTIERIKDTGAPNTSKQRISYLLAKDLDEKTFDRIWLEQNLFRAVTATLWKEPRTVLYRIMPNLQHEGMIARFRSRLLQPLMEMGLSDLRKDFASFGSARVYGHGTAKEPDYSFYPAGSLNPGSTRGPSLVLEVGVSDSYHRLLQDAHWWYSNSPIRPNLVVLIHAAMSPKFSVCMEVWTDTHVNNRYSTRSSTSSRLERSQQVRVEDNVVYGGPLRLDFELLMRRPPNSPVERDVVMSDEMLLFIAEQE